MLALDDSYCVIIPRRWPEDPDRTNERQRHGSSAQGRGRRRAGVSSAKRTGMVGRTSFAFRSTCASIALTLDRTAHLSSVVLGLDPRTHAASTAFASQQRRMEIIPFGIDRLDQIDLPSPVPAFQRLLALYRTADIPILLVPDETGAAITRQSPASALTMFIDAALQIGCHADIERTVFLVGDDVDISRHAGRVLGRGSQGQAQV